jgi:hypothetical protein
MPITIKVNGTSNSLVHKMSNGISNATIPDVCKTPTPGGPVPMPYPNIAQSVTLSDGTTTVKGDRMMAANKGSKFALSNGDNAGVAGGVKSSTFMKEATWILYSFDVKLNGKNASRFTDKMFHNAENAANLGGEINPPISVSEFEKILRECVEKAADEVDREHKAPSRKAPKRAWNAWCNAQVIGKDGQVVSRAMALGEEKGAKAEQCVEAEMAALGRSNEVSTQGTYVSTPAGAQSVAAGSRISGSLRPDVVLHAAGQPNVVRAVYDIKNPCPRSNMPKWGQRLKTATTQGEEYLAMFRMVPKIVAPGWKIAPYLGTAGVAAARAMGLM